MSIPKYCFIEPQTDWPGAGVILHTKAPPYILGKVVKLKGEFAIIDYKTQSQPLAYAQCGMYNIIIAYAGNLNGNTIKVTGVDWKEKLQETVNGMAEWFLNEKIKPNAGYYKKYLT